MAARIISIILVLFFLGLFLPAGIFDLLTAGRFSVVRETAWPLLLQGLRQMFRARREAQDLTDPALLTRREKFLRSRLWVLLVLPVAILRSVLVVLFAPIIGIVGGVRSAHTYFVGHEEWHDALSDPEDQEGEASPGLVPEDLPPPGFVPPLPEA